MSCTPWQFKYLDEKERAYGDIKKRINYLITSYPSSKECEADGNLICHSIWLGNGTLAHDLTFVTDEKIKHIINATPNISNKFQFINYTNFPIKDKIAFDIDIIQLLNRGADIINYAIEHDWPILIHCKQGHHRSASIVVFYLMKYKKMDLFDAIYFIKQRRPTVFGRMTRILEELIKYENDRMNHSPK